ncbi:MAG: hypothetical protein ABI091_28790 [Ferruginibacter sp.]
MAPYPFIGYTSTLPGTNSLVTLPQIFSLVPFTISFFEVLSPPLHEKIQYCQNKNLHTAVN